MAAGLAVALILLGVRLHDRLHQLRVERDEFPGTAFQYMADQDLGGNLVVTYNWAQYAISVFCSKQPGGGRMRVGFDGRFRTCYPQEVVDMHFDFVLGNGGPEHRWRGPESPQFNPCHVLQFKQPDLSFDQPFANACRAVYGPATGPLGPDLPGRIGPTFGTSGPLRRFGERALLAGRPPPRIQRAAVGFGSVSGASPVYRA